jgi:hypothetical protein
MDEDDEIQSHQSPETGSPVSPRPNGRITVTVASAPPATAQNALALIALPVQRARSGGGGSGGGGGREDCWSEDATSVLIDAWGERYLQLSRGNLKQKHWKEVADIVSSTEDYGKTPKTDIQCKNRIDTVKKKYKLEKAKVASGGGPSKWTFFDRLDQLIGPTAKIAVSSPSPPLQQPKVPLGIPVRIRSSSVNLLSNNSNNSQFLNKQPQKKQEEAVMSRTQQLGKRGGRELESDSEADSMDSLGQAGTPTATATATATGTNERKKPRRMMVMAGREGRGVGGGGGGGKGEWGNAARELTQAILKFGEAYEQAESAKLQQVVEMEKQRMKFAKELELQRMQFFMKTQLEISQLKKPGGRRGGGGTAAGGGGNASNHHSNNNTNNNNSDSSN